MSLRALPGNADVERRALLAQYLKAWLLSHALTVGDLTRSEIRDALLKTLSADLGHIVGSSVDTIAGYVGMRAARAATDALQKGVSKFLGWAGKQL